MADNKNNRYTTAFKKRHSGRLFWVYNNAANDEDALEKAKEHMGFYDRQVRDKNKRYKVYAGPLLEKSKTTV